MNELTFQGGDTFEITLQSPPTATSEGKIVVVTLPVFAAGFPKSTAQIEVILSIDDAEQLESQLHPALVMARIRAKHG